MCLTGDLRPETQPFMFNPESLNMASTPTPLEEILRLAPPADETLRAEHITQFVHSFIEKSRRDRWIHLLLKPSETTRRTSYKLDRDLDRSFCRLIDGPPQLLPRQLNSRQIGIFDDLSGSPKQVKLEQLWNSQVDPFCDNLFLIRAGELALFFFHEFELFLCERST